jgi:hypothetical protein
MAAVSAETGTSNVTTDQWRRVQRGGPMGMKSMQMARILAVAVLVTAYPEAFAADVGIAKDIGQASYYGRLDITGDAYPEVIDRQPIVAAPTGPETEYRHPTYLRVRPGHIKHWLKHCGEYGACREPVLFVRDDWYQREYLRTHKNDPDRTAGNSVIGADEQGTNGQGTEIHSEDDAESNDHLRYAVLSPGYFCPAPRD